jgi:hypothetical protein
MTRELKAIQTESEMGGKVCESHDERIERLNCQECTQLLSLEESHDERIES